MTAGETVTLDGSGSRDPESQPLSVADTAPPSFTAPEGPATLEFSLTVNDGTHDSAADTVLITVAEAAPDNPSTFSGDTTGAVTEDAADNTDTGNLSLSDPDADDNPTIEAQTHPGTYGSLAVFDGGAWTYTLHNTDADTNTLGAGATGMETLTITASEPLSMPGDYDVTVTASDGQRKHGVD